MSTYLSSDLIWQEDAEKFSPGDNSSSVIYREPSIISGFLLTGGSDSSSILIGAKGTGKSLLLREKSYLYIKHGDYINASGTNLVENIEFNTAYGATDLLRLTLATRLEVFDIRHLTETCYW